MLTEFQVDVVKAIREAFDQLRFLYRSEDRGVYKGGFRVWVPWQEKPLEGRKGWTGAVKTTLCKVGHQIDDKIRVGCHGVPMADYGEWLWDITWCRENAQKEIADLPLVAECELANMYVEGIVEDFQKLLVARADVRLMIHEHFFDGEQVGIHEEGLHRAPAMANHLAKHVQAYRHTYPDDAYLSIALDGTESEDGFCRIRYFRLKADGTAVEWNEGRPNPFKDDDLVRQ